MSNSSKRNTDGGSRFEAATPASLRWGLRLVAAPLRFVAFWLAVALPFLYMPLLYGGLSGGQLEAFVALLALNVLALVFGHGHRRRTAGSEPKGT